MTQDPFFGLEEKLDQQITVLEVRGEAFFAEVTPSQANALWWASKVPGFSLASYSSEARAIDQDIKDLTQCLTLIKDNRARFASVDDAELQRRVKFVDVQRQRWKALEDKVRNPLKHADSNRPKAPPEFRCSAYTPAGLVYLKTASSGAEPSSIQSRQSQSPIQSQSTYALVPLQAVRVHVTIVDLNSHVLVEHVYLNQEADPIETRYVFPMEPGASVCGFEAHLSLSNTTLVGTIKEKEEAKQIYTTAVSMAKQAVLMERDAPNSQFFVCHIGNLLPQERCTIRLQYLKEVQLDSNTVINWSLPTVVAPPYHRPELGPAPPGGPAGGDATPPTVSAPRWHWSQIPYRLNITADLHMPSPITQLQSTTHPNILHEAISALHHRMRLPADVTALNKDFVLTFAQKEPFARRATLEFLTEPVNSGEDLAKEGAKAERKDLKAEVLPPVREHKVNEGEGGDGEHQGEGEEGRPSGNAPILPTHGAAVQVAFYSPSISLEQALTSSASEFVFVVDRSGSMSGSALRNVQTALQIFLRSLPKGCLFNIVSFEDSYTLLFSQGSRPYTPESLALATAFVDALTSGGGTELLACLNHVLHLPCKKGFSRQMFVLTDGQVTNRDAVIAAVAAARNVRVFGMGIGSSVDRALVQGISLAGHGDTEFIVENDKIAEKVTALLVRGLQPHLQSVSVNWQDLPLEMEGQKGSPQFIQCPQHIASVFPGRAYFLYALLPCKDAQLSARCTLTVTATFADQSVQTFALPLDPAVNVRHGTLIHKFAARARIAELELPFKDRGYGINAADSAPSQDDPELVRQQIIRLSQQYTLLSAHTSFVAVRDEPILPDSTDGAVKPPVLREVPLEFTAGTYLSFWARLHADTTPRGSRVFIQDSQQMNSCCSTGFEMPSAPSRTTQGAREAEQDAVLDDMAAAVARLKDVSAGIGTELKDGSMLDSLDSEMDTTDSSWQSFKKSARKWFSSPSSATPPKSSSTSSAASSSSFASPFSSASPSPSAFRTTNARGSAAANNGDAALTLAQAKRMLEETEGTADATLQSLAQQREIIQRTHDNNRKVQGGLGSSNRLLSSMSKWWRDSPSTSSSSPITTSAQGTSARSSLAIAEASSPVTSSSSVSSSAFYTSLIRAQRSDGSWLLGDIRGLSSTPDDSELQQRLTDQKVELKASADRELVLGTLLALVWLSSRLGSKRSEWHVLAIKAKRFLLENTFGESKRLVDSF